MPPTSSSSEDEHDESDDTPPPKRFCPTACHGGPSTSARTEPFSINVDGHDNPNEIATTSSGPLDLAIREAIVTTKSEVALSAETENQDIATTTSGPLDLPIRKAIITTKTEAALCTETENEDIRLGERIRALMICNVCLDVPHPNDGYLCSNCHIICYSCVTHLLSDAFLYYKEAHCPVCRVVISWSALTANVLPLKQVLYELPVACSQCEKLIDYKSIEGHLSDECLKRILNCKYRCLGCEWHGNVEDKVMHETSCHFPDKTAAEILVALDNLDMQETEKQKPLKICFERLSTNRIVFHDLTMKHVPSYDVENRILLDHSISAFEYTWDLKMKISPIQDQSNELEISSSERDLCYALSVLGRLNEPMTISYFVTIPSTPDTARFINDVLVHMYQFTYVSKKQSSEYQKLPLTAKPNIYHLLAMEKLPVRLWMFLH